MSHSGQIHQTEERQEAAKRGARHSVPLGWAAQRENLGGLREWQELVRPSRFSRPRMCLLSEYDGVTSSIVPKFEEYTLLKNC